MRSLTVSIATAVATGLASLGVLQPSGSITVCVGADRVLRAQSGSACPGGQTSYHLGGGGAAPGGEDKASASQLADLKKTIDFLRDRVAHLEAAQKDVEVNAKIATRVIAPFEVVDKSGRLIFTVSDASFSSAKRGRVHIGPGSADNYAVLVSNSGGVVAAGMGEARVGGGGSLSLLLQGKERTSVSAAEGVAIKNSAGESVAELEFNPESRERALVQITGRLNIINAQGEISVMAASYPDGRGVVMTSPNKDCKSYAGLRSPECIMGTKK